MAQHELVFHASSHVSRKEVQSRLKVGHIATVAAFGLIPFDLHPGSSNF